MKNGFGRLPTHVGIIPDGNRRWAEARGRSRAEGYAAGIEPGLALLARCRELGIEEVSVYGFTKENVRRPGDQVEAFRTACVELGRRALESGAALLAVGDPGSRLFPDELRPYAERRAPGDVRLNLLVNYGWRWDLLAALTHARANGPIGASDVPAALGSAGVSRIDLVVRWGGRQRLSGFLPMQCAYADFRSVETLWPDMRVEELDDALHWYERQDVTLGG